MYDAIKNQRPFAPGIFTRFFPSEGRRFPWRPVRPRLSRARRKSFAIFLRPTKMSYVDFFLMRTLTAVDVYNLQCYLTYAFVTKLIAY